MPTNLYGPGRQLRPDLVARAAGHDPQVPRREGLGWTRRRCGAPGPRAASSSTSTTSPSAVVHLLRTYDSLGTINVGTGEDISIHELAAIIASVVDYGGATIWDTSKPDGTPRKLLDVSRLRALGWTPSIQLYDGLRATYEWYLNNTAARQGHDQ